MEQMLKLIVKTIADGAGKDEDEEGGHELEDSSASEKMDSESGRESDGEDKRAPGIEGDDDDSAPATPPAKCQRRADPSVTASSPAMNTRRHSRSQPFSKPVSHNTVPLSALNTMICRHVTF
jgi:hypothetical protein